MSARRNRPRWRRSKRYGHLQPSPENRIVAPECRGRNVLRHARIQDRGQAGGAPERRRRLAGSGHHIRGTPRNVSRRSRDILHHRSLFEIPMDTSPPVACVSGRTTRSPEQSLATSLNSAPLLQTPTTRPLRRKDSYSPQSPAPRPATEGR
jgi:hypothetical protein